MIKVTSNAMFIILITFAGVSMAEDDDSGVNLGSSANLALRSIQEQSCVFEPSCTPSVNSSFNQLSESNSSAGFWQSPESEPTAPASIGYDGFAGSISEVGSGQNLCGVSNSLSLSSMMNTGGSVTPQAESVPATQSAGSAN